MGLMAAISSAIAIVAMTCPALAQRVLPPVEYDHPYSGRLVKFRKNTIEDVRASCKTPLAMGLGCAWLVSEGFCVIIMASDDVIEAAGHDPDVVLRHETAHCNGWPKEHPGTRMWVRQKTKEAPTP
jgi:hypothetical protein